jgi:hypothetical protein
MAFESIIGIIALACAIWVIYDVFAKNKELSTGVKIIWTIGALLFSIITAIIYFFVGRKK